MCYKDKKYNDKFPMTLEGCVVRLSDIISYLGRDIEDAERLGVLNSKEIPESITKVLGNNNREIVSTIVTDVIMNSMDKPYIKLSDEVYKAMQELMNFNYKNIYYKSMSKDELEYYREGMNCIYNFYKKAVVENDKNNEIFRIFLDNQNNYYMENTSSERKVIDYIAGMTDDFFITRVQKVYKK